MGATIANCITYFSAKILNTGKTVWGYTLLQTSPKPLDIRGSGTGGDCLTTVCCMVPEKPVDAI